MPDTDTVQYCTFHLADLFFGVAVDRVQEVLRHQEMTTVPLASPVIGGLINLRGQIVTAIDLRRRLGMPDRDPSQMPMNVVIRSEDGAVALLVDDIGDVLDADDRSFEPPPATLRGSLRPLVRGVHKMTQRLMLILDVDRALTVEGTG